MNVLIIIRIGQSAAKLPILNNKLVRGFMLKNKIKGLNRITKFSINKLISDIGIK